MLLFSFFLCMLCHPFLLHCLYPKAINKKNEGLIIYSCFIVFDVVIFWRLFIYWELFWFVLSGLLSWFGIMYICTWTSCISSSFTRNGQYNFTRTGRNVNIFVNGINNFKNRLFKSSATQGGQTTFRTLLYGHAVLLRHYHSQMVKKIFFDKKKKQKRNNFEFSTWVVYRQVHQMTSSLLM